MSKFQKLRIHHFLKWAPLLCAESYFTSSNPNLCVNGSHRLLRNIRFCATESAVSLRNCGSLDELAKRSRVARREAQAAVLDYFHLTRNFQIMDADNMSKNAPEFFDRLLKRVDVGDAEVGRSVARFLRYHPVNEFEPFFESIGLKPSEYSSFLPRNLMFLNDDEFLLENYYVLCNYGIARNRIGKIYKEAREVFCYEYGVLKSKLQFIQNLGLKQTLVVKLVACSPHLLRGDTDQEFVEVLENLKTVGIDYDWLDEHISVEDSYNWKSMVELFDLLSELGLTGKQLGEVIKQHPDLLLDGSGCVTFRLCGLFMKVGCTATDIKLAFLQFPKISVLKFTNNLCHCYNFLVEIEMDVEDIGRIAHSHPTLLGSCEPKKVRSLLKALNCQKSRLCQMIKDDPCLLKKWALGVKVNPLEEQKRVLNVRLIKTEFLLSLGFEEKSMEMEEALKVCRGRGMELQERFDCLVNLGFSRDKVIQMIKECSQILNQSSDVTATKVGFFVRDLGYSLSDLLAHPKLLCYTIPRLKLRLLMYKWLRDEGAVRPNLALSTLLSSSEEKFVKRYVNAHPRGPDFLGRLKNEIYPDSN